MKKRIVSLAVALMFLVNSAAVAHPGRTDSYGGHNVRKSGWGYPVGTYHYHSGPYAGYTVDYQGQVPVQVKEGNKKKSPKKTVKKKTVTKKVNNKTVKKTKKAA